MVCASEEAAQEGVYPGMTLAHARALCPGLVDAEHDPQSDRKGLEGLARWMMRFSPQVGLYAVQEDLLPAIFVDVTGCERVFGGLANLMEQAREDLRRMKLSVRLAIAPSLGSAWAIASCGQEDGKIVRPDQLRSALKDLPVRALRIGEEMVQSLYHLGIQTIGQLLELPREALPARFGTILLQRIDQALARVNEPLVAMGHEAPISARLDFDGAVDSLEAIWRVFQWLIGKIVQELHRRGCGARRVEVEFFRPYASSIVKTIFLSRPSRDPVRLFNLMRCAMEGLEEEARRHGGTKARRGKSLLAHVSDADSMTCDGFVGIGLAVPVFEKITQEQIRLMEGEEFDGRLELDSLIERLCLRLGEEGVGQAELIESYIPERAWGISLAPCTHGERVRVRGNLRPLHLLPRPEEIAVMVSPSHDLEGRPISFTRQGTVHRLVESLGPERISGQWWEGHNKTRDYFLTEDEEAGRWWVFRVVETRKWYLHGIFE